MAKVVAIDGPAGSGKSTTASATAERLGFAHLDSGALYRAVTLAALDAGVEMVGDRVVRLARTLPVRLVLAAGRIRPELAGADVSGSIREPRVTARVSEVAALAVVREWVTDQLRAMAARHPAGLVADGRDMGSVVFPDAPIKIYLTADRRERARRRAAEMGGPVTETSLERVAAGLSERDARDSRREHAPLKPAADAVVLDTTDLTPEEAVERVVALARNALS